MLEIKSKFEFKVWSGHILSASTCISSSDVNIPVVSLCAFKTVNKWFTIFLNRLALTGYWRLGFTPSRSPSIVTKAYGPA